jgi:hypothetical protein
MVKINCFVSYDGNEMQYCAKLWDGAFSLSFK